MKFHGVYITDFHEIQLGVDIPPLENADGRTKEGKRIKNIHKRLNALNDLSHLAYELGLDSPVDLFRHD